MKLHAYLTFDGQCEAAMTFYAELFDGNLELMRFGESPEAEQVPEQYHQRIMHACLLADGQILMASDTFPQHPYAGIQGCSVSVQLDNVPEAERLYEALSAAGEIQMELQATFWASRFAMFTDRFGVPWMINCAVDSQQG